MTRKIDVIPCGEILHRLVLKKNHLDPDSGQPLPDAFMLRAVDKTGISVDLKNLRTVEESVASMNRVHGVASLHTGHVRNVNALDAASEERVSLDVIHEPIDSPPEEKNPAHAEIRGIPRREDNPKEAEFVTGQLAKQARIVPISKR